MSAAEIAGRVAGPTYLSGNTLGTTASVTLGVAASRVAVDVDEHAPMTKAAIAPMMNEERLTLAPW